MAVSVDNSSNEIDNIGATSEDTTIIKGDQGEAGIGIKNISFETAETGDVIMTITLTDDSTYTATLPRGPKGEQGERGAHGHMGPKGDKGDQGEIGHGLIIGGFAKSPMDLPLACCNDEYLNKIYLVDTNLYICVGTKNGDTNTPNYAWRLIGPACPDGDSAYDVYRKVELAKGTEETDLLSEEDWITSLHGKDVLELINESLDEDSKYNTIEDYLTAKCDIELKPVIMGIIATAHDKESITEAEFAEYISGNGIKDCSAVIDEETGNTKVTLSYTKSGDTAEFTINKGDKGADGKSAYDLYIEQWKSSHPDEEVPEAVVTEEQWLANYVKGKKGNPGLSAYEVAKSEWLSNEINGAWPHLNDEGDDDIEAWIKSLNGKDGNNGLSAFQLAKTLSGDTWEYGDNIQAWINSLKGEKGDQGEKGAQGSSAFEVWKSNLLAENPDAAVTFDDYKASLKGVPGESAYTIAKSAGLTNIEDPVEWVKSLQGTNGESAYDTYVKLQKEKGEDYYTTEASWLSSLKGDPGDPFKITGIYSSYEEMIKNSISVNVGDFAVISTKELTDEDNGKLYLRVNDGFGENSTSWQFICDLADADIKGPKGDAGENGLSAFELAQSENGKNYPYDTIENWIASLTGEKGEKGDRGLSAFEIARTVHGTEYPYDTVENWINSLKGDRGDAGVAGTNGTDGKSAWELYIKNGGTLSESDWLNTLIGKSSYESYCDIMGIDSTLSTSKTKYVAALKGDKGDQGIQGEKGSDGEKGEKGDKGTGIVSLTFVGTDSESGANVYTLKLSDGTTYTLEAPKGDKGDRGLQGLQGAQGIQGVQGPKGDTGICPVFSCKEDAETYASGNYPTSIGQIISVSNASATTFWYVTYSGDLKQLGLGSNSDTNTDTINVENWYNTGVLSFECKDDLLKAIKQCKGSLNYYLAVVRDNMQLYSINKWPDGSNLTEDNYITLLSQASDYISESHSIVIDTTTITKSTTTNDTIGYTVDWDGNKIVVTMSSQCPVHAFPTVKVLNASGHLEAELDVSYNSLASTTVEAGRSITIAWSESDYNNAIEQYSVRYIVLS